MNRFFKSFYFAWKGIRTAFSEQTNIKIHLAVTLIVAFAGYYFKITNTEWLILVLTFGFVITAELLNTAIEYIVNMISPNYQTLAGKIKDIAAAAVLVAAITAAVVGIIIFEKYIF